METEDSRGPIGCFRRPVRHGGRDVANPDFPSCGLRNGRDPISIGGAAVVDRVHDLILRKLAPSRRCNCIGNILYMNGSQQSRSPIGEGKVEFSKIPDRRQHRH